MAFPGPYAEIFTNEAGEVIGWDNHYYDEPPEPTEEDERRADFYAMLAEDREEEATTWLDEGDEPMPVGATMEGWVNHACAKDQIRLPIEEAWHNYVSFWESKLT